MYNSSLECPAALKLPFKIKTRFWFHVILVCFWESSDVSLMDGIHVLQGPSHPREEPFTPSQAPSEFSSGLLTELSQLARQVSVVKPVRHKARANSSTLTPVQRKLEGASEVNKPRALVLQLSPSTVKWLFWGHTKQEGKAQHRTHLSWVPIHYSFQSTVQLHRILFYFKQLKYLRPTK